MRVALLANETAGRGRAMQAARLAAAELSAAGSEALIVPVGPDADPTIAAERIAQAELVVASGGDGTVLHAAGTILALPRGDAACPAIYHLPCGNENLFAREFGMSRRADALVRALAARRIRRVDVGWIGGEGLAPIPFLIMASIGPDASVIHRLARTRRRLTGHAAYMGPVLAEILAPRFPRMRVRVDDRSIAGGPAEADQGILVVGNSRQYALRLDPALRASIGDGKLDAVFLPCRTRTRAVRWAIQCRFRRHLTDSATRYAQGEGVAVESVDGRPLPVQVDGEAFAPERPVRSIVISVSPGVLPVLLPA